MDAKWHQSAVSWGQFLAAVALVVIPVILDRISIEYRLSRFEARQEIVFSALLDIKVVKEKLDSIRDELIRHESATLAK